MKSFQDVRVKPRQQWRGFFCSQHVGGALTGIGWFLDSYQQHRGCAVLCRLSGRLDRTLPRADRLSAQLRSVFLHVRAGMTVIVEDRKDWRMADGIWVDGGARNPKVPTLFKWLMSIRASATVSTLTLCYIVPRC